MAKLRFNITMSLDGYVAGPDQSLEHPLGVGGEALHEWALATRSFRATHGMEGGATGLDDDQVASWKANIGATLMGRNMFGPVRGDWKDEEWRRLVGRRPAVPHARLRPDASPARPRRDGGRHHLPLRHRRDRGSARAAVDAAEGRDVSIGGGASVAQQYLRAGLVDELTIHVVPLLLGDGARLFEDLEGASKGYECVELTSSSSVAHFAYVRKDAA